MNAPLGALFGWGVGLYPALIRAAVDLLTQRFFENRLLHEAFRREAIVIFALLGLKLRLNAVHVFEHGIAFIVAVIRLRDFGVLEHITVFVRVIINHRRGGADLRRLMILIFARRDRLYPITNLRRLRLATRREDRTARLGLLRTRESHL